MASFEILLSSVRSETPTSFFLVLSKTAFLTCCLPPLLGGAIPPASFLRPARLVTACPLSSQQSSSRTKENIGRKPLRVAGIVASLPLGAQRGILNYALSTAKLRLVFVWGS